jgi:Family of unknown function (DUF6612)
MKRKGIGSGLILAVILSVSLAAVQLSGCGLTPTGQMLDATALFNQARESTKTAASFRMNGKVNAEFTFPPVSGSLDIDYDMCFEQKEGGEPIVQLVMDLHSGESGDLLGIPDGMEIKGYMIGNRFYLKNPLSGDWNYMEVSFSDMLSGMGQGVSPQDMLDLMDAADSVEVVSDNSFFTKYALVLNADKLLGKADMGTLEEQIKKAGGPAMDISEYIAFTRDLVSAMNVSVTVDKKSGQVALFEMSFDDNLFDFMRPLFKDDPPPEGSSMTMSMNFNIGDYGKSFNLELPEAAKSARSFRSLEE